MLNFRQIEAFRAVMLSGSMTQAAKDLHTSQPNISRVIGQLERKIGLKLFERHAGKLVPTLEGQMFFRDVEHTFAGLLNLEEAANTIGKRGVGRLRIVSVPSMATFVVPEAIQDFSQRFPDTSVALHVADSLTVCQWLATGYADIGIASEIFNASSITVQTVQTNAGVCIVSPEHRLARLTRPVTPQDLVGEPFVSLKSSDAMRKHIDEICQIDGKEKRILTCESHFAAAIFHMVSRGMGVSIANPLMASYYRDKIVMQPFLPTITFFTYAVLPANGPANMLTKAFGLSLQAATRLTQACQQAQRRHNHVLSTQKITGSDRSRACGNGKPADRATGQGTNDQLAQPPNQTGRPF